MSLERAGGWLLYSITSMLDEYDGIKKVCFNLSQIVEFETQTKLMRFINFLIKQYIIIIIIIYIKKIFGSNNNTKHN